jgi:hypothetical protein
MEAWHIISENLTNYYRMRRGLGIEKGYVPADIEAEVICFLAFKQMEERMNNNET